MEGLVLRLIDYGETDQIARLFLKETGILSAIAKGIKKSQRRFPHHLEPFRLYNFKLSKKPTHDLYWIQSADQIASFDGILTDIRKIALGHVLMELVLKGVREGPPQKNLYALLISLLQSLESCENIFNLWFYSEIHILRLLGFLPNFSTCHRCKRPLAKESSPCFDPVSGGLICPRCQKSASQKGTLLGAEALSALQFLTKAPLPSIARLKISEESRTTMADFLTEYITFHLERPLQSISFLKEVVE